MSTPIVPFSNTPCTFGVLIYPDTDIADFSGPHVVFSSVRLNEEQRRETESPIRQLLISNSLEPVRTSGGIRLLPDVDLDSCPRLDFLLVPGGDGARSLIHQSEYLDFLKRVVPGLERLIAVKFGTLIVAAAGLLVGKSATTHFHAVDIFRERFPRTSLFPELPIVMDGNIITANCVSASMDVAFYLVANLYGPEVAREAARQMEYPYPEQLNLRARNLK